MRISDSDLAGLVGEYVTVRYLDGRGGSGTVAEIIYTSEGRAILLDYGYSFDVDVDGATIAVGEIEEPTR